MTYTRKKGGVRLRLLRPRNKPKPMDTDGTDPKNVVLIKNYNQSRKKNRTSNSRYGVAKKTSGRNPTLQRVRKAVEDRIKITIEKPKFKSSFAGQLYEFFYRDENGPYQLFKKLKNDYQGTFIPIESLKSDDYNKMITLLKEDLNHFEESVSKLSKIKIPTLVNDELATLLFSLTSMKEAKKEE